VLAGRWLDMITGMNFMIPADGSLFEIPDPWLAQAGVGNACAPKQRHYICADVAEQAVLFVPLKVIAPPRRTPGMIGLDQARAVCKRLAKSSPQFPLDRGR
jgi:hypothetical protein